MKTVQQRIGDYVVTYRQPLLTPVLIPTDLPIYRNLNTGVIVAQAIIFHDDRENFIVLSEPGVLVVFPDKSKVLFKDKSMPEVCAQYIFV